MLKFNNLLRILILFLISFQSYTQDYTYFNYTIENILPSSEVYHIYQDKSGFIWFATDNGVVRFDGGDFITFNKSNGLADVVVFRIHDDAAGNLYFRSFSGLISKYANGEMRPYPYNHHIKEIVGKSLISSLIVDTLGTLHLSTSSSSIGKIASIDTLGKVSSFIQPPATLFIRQINREILIGSRGTFGSIKNVSIDNKIFRIARQDSLQSNGVLCYAFWKKQIYISKDHYLYKFNGQSVNLVKRFEKPIVSISLDHDDYLWIGQMNGGVERFSDSTFQFGFKIPIFQKTSVTTVLEDNEGGFWFSTLEKGVFYLPNLKIHNYNYPAYSKVNAVAGSGDFIFIGFNSGKLIAINVATRKEAWSMNLKDPIMSALYDQFKNELWISTNSKTEVFSNDGKILREVDEVKSIKKFFRFPSNEIGALNSKGIYKVTTTGNLKVEKEFDFWLRNLLITESKVYLAGITGIFKTDLTFSNIEPLKELETVKVSDIQLLPNKQVLIASVGNGISIISENGTVLPKEENNFLFENAYQVWIDSCIWIATDKGMFRTAIEDIINNRLSRYDFIGKGTGLLSDKVSFIWRFPNETWCFLNDGFSIMKNNEIEYANRRPKDYVKSIFINNEVVKDTLYYDLPYHKNYIGISLGFISFNNRNIIVRHRLNHSDKVWNYSRGTSLEYFSLMPDSYAFDIQFSSDNASWTDVNFPQTFIIHPPWWESYYFKATLFFLIIFSSYFIFRVRYSRKLSKLEMQSKLQFERERIARDLHDSLGGQLSSISIGVNRLGRENNIDNIQTVQDLTDKAIAELRDSLWVMDKEAISIGEIEQRVNSLFWQYRKIEVPIIFSAKVKDNVLTHRLKASLAGNLFRIIQEATHNCVKHSQCSYFEIGIEEKERGIQVTIVDDGIGFDLPKQQGKEHHGLRNIKVRAAQMETKLFIESSHGKGVKITLLLPKLS